LTRGCKRLLDSSWPASHSQTINRPGSESGIGSEFRPAPFTLAVAMTWQHYHFWGLVIEERVNWCGEAQFVFIMYIDAATGLNDLLTSASKIYSLLLRLIHIAQIIPDKKEKM